MAGTDVLHQSYDRMMQKVKDLAVVYSIDAMMNWDMETKMPPEKSAVRNARSN
jgi:Zn-dependent M32 family carboxypeptidase